MSLQQSRWLFSLDQIDVPLSRDSFIRSSSESNRGRSGDENGDDKYEEQRFGPVHGTIK